MSLAIRLRLPTDLRFADLVILHSVMCNAKDLVAVTDMYLPHSVVNVNAQSSDFHQPVVATLCIGVLPDPADPNPVLVRGVPLAEESTIPDLTICTNTKRIIESSAGYASGIQRVGNFLAPPMGIREKSGVIDLRQIHGHSTGKPEQDVFSILASAERVIDTPSSPVASASLALGTAVTLLGEVDERWPVLAEHIEDGERRPASGGSDATVVPLPRVLRDRSDPGAGPRVARLLRQAAYLF